MKTGAKFVGLRTGLNRKEGMELSVYIKGLLSDCKRLNKDSIRLNCFIIVLTKSTDLNFEAATKQSVLLAVRIFH